MNKNFNNVIHKANSILMHEYRMSNILSIDCTTMQAENETVAYEPSYMNM